MSSWDTQLAGRGAIRSILQHSEFKKSDDDDDDGKRGKWLEEQWYDG